MQTRLSLALLLVAITACTEGALPVNAGKGSPVADATRSTVSVNPPELVADGVAKSTITITLLDKGGLPIQGMDVELSASGELNTLVQPAKTNASGVTTATIASTRAGTKRLTLRAGSGSKVVELEQHPDVKFNAGPPAKLAFLVQPASGAAGATLSEVQVAAVDANNNRVTTPVTVELTLVNGTPGAVLGGTASRASTAGVAAFGDLVIQRAGTGYTLRATAQGLTEATSSAFDITAGAVSTITTTFEVGPDNVVANGTTATTATLIARDAFNNPLSGQAVSFAVSGSGNTLEPTSGITDAEGKFVAALRSTKAESKTLTATLGGAELQQKPSVTFIPGPPAKLAFVTQPPTSALAGQTLSAVQVAVLDAQDNPSMAAVPVALTLQGGTAGATLSGTTPRNATGGVAAFNDLSIQRAGAGYSLRATATNLTEATSNTFTITAGAVSLITTTVVAEPDQVVADGTAASTITVTVMDGFGNAVGGRTVGLSVSGTGNTLSNATLTTDAVSGKAVATLRSTKSERKTVTTTIDGTDLNKPVEVTFIPGPPAKLAFLRQPPASSVAGKAFTPSVQVEVLDANNNRTVASSARVKVDLVTTSATATLDGTKEVNTTVGVASFSDLNIKTAGSYVLRASTVPAAGLQTADSITFDIIADVPASSTTTFTATPNPVVASDTVTSALKVTVKDQYGNAVEGKAVTLAVTSGQLNVLTPTSGNTNAVGEFTATYKSTKAEVKQLQATVADLATPKSLSLTVSPGPLDSVVLTANPTTVEADGTPINLTASAQDGFANPIPNLDMTLAFTSTSFSGTLPVPAPASAKTDANGELKATLLSNGTGYGQGQVRASAGTPEKADAKSVTFLRPAATVLGFAVNGPAEGCVTFDYTVSQKEAARTDIRVEYSLDGTTFKRATQAGSLTGSGVSAVATSAAGTAHSFLWNSTADVPAADVTVAQVRITTVLEGALEKNATLTNVALKNGARFGAADRFTAGSAPQALAVADMDRDGKLDVVTINPSGNNFSVLKGSGTGTFAEVPTLTVDTQSTLLQVADFNRDGRPDVVTSGGSAKEFRVTRNGAGGYAAFATVTTPELVVAMVTGDFTRDGNPDVVVADQVGAVRLYASNGAGTFTNPSNVLNAGTQLRQLAAGDFDRDGFLDVAVSGAAGVKLLRGASSGFTDAGVVDSTTDADVLLAEDVNANGALDLLVARRSAGTFVVALGSGTGAFSQGVPITVGAQLSGVALKDMDGDGRLDALVSGVGQTVVYLKGLGGGAFGTAVSLAAGGATAAVAAADVNGDGRLDVLTTRPGDNSLLRMSGAQVARCESSLVAAQLYSVDAAPSSAVLVDFTGDGRVDMAVASANANSIKFARGLGNGKFETPMTTLGLGGGATKPVGLTAGDFNGDGWADLASANATTGNVSVFINNKAGGFAAANVRPLTGGTPRGLAAGHFNNDAFQDLVVTNSAGGNVVVLFGDAAGNLGNATDVSVGSNTNPYAVVVGDFNADGRQDLATANFANGSVSTLLGNGNGGFGTPIVRLTGSGARALVAGLVDGDQRLDLVVTTGDENVTILRGNADGSFTPLLTTPQVGFQPVGLALGDFDGDKDIDLASASNVAASITLLHGDGQGAFVASSRVAGAGLSSIQGADLDGDGRTDLVATLGGSEQQLSSPDNRVAVLRSAGNHGTVTALSATNSSSTLGLTSADINMDGLPEVLAAASGSTSLVQWRALGSGGFQAGESITLVNAPVAVAVGDVNRDGKPDAVVASRAGNNFTVLTGNGSGQLTVGSSRGSVQGPAGLVLEDFDADGDLDLVVASDTVTNVQVHPNDGTGSFGNSANANSFSGFAPVAMAFADFTGDGRKDLVGIGTNGGNGQVGVLPSNGTTGFTLAKTTPMTGVAAGLDPVALAVGDLDGNGTQDVVVATRHASTPSVVTLLGVGDGTFTATAASPRVTLTVQPRGLALADMDGDGLLDLIVSAASGLNPAPAANSVTILRGAAGGSFSNPQSWAINQGITLASMASPIGVADLNQDGLPDLFTSGSQGAGVVYLR